MPTTHAYTGSEEFIRLQFEEYLLALLSCVKYRSYIDRRQNDANGPAVEACKYYLYKIQYSPELIFRDGNPMTDFGTDWINSWKKTDNYRIFDKFTGSDGWFYYIDGR